MSNKPNPSKPRPAPKGGGKSKPRPAPAAKAPAAPPPKRQSNSRTAKARQAQQRSRTTTIVIIGVVLVIGIALVIAVSTSSNSKSSASVSAAEAKAIVATVAAVPQATTEQVGKGIVTAVPLPTNGKALTSGGKPELLYIGAEFCPYCAAERWSLANALTRFGSFTGVGVTHSSGTDVYPNTATLTFHGATYTSKYLTFTGVETESNKQTSTGGYAPLDKLTPAQNALWSGLDPKQAFPFIDIGGKYWLHGASYNPQLLAGKTAKEIAAALKDPTDAITRSVLGVANNITAAICAVTNNTPATVCTSTIKALQKDITA